MQTIVSEHLCMLDEIEDPGTRVIRRKERAFVLYRRGGLVTAFVNACPHTGARLDTMDPDLLDDTGHLVCSVHGARFDGDGLCVSGPCRGRSLTPIPVVVEDGIIRMPS